MTTTVIIESLTLEEKALFLRDLKEAYFSGASRVKFRERDVTYRSADEMRRIIAELESSLIIKKRKDVILTTFGRGY